jgi:hypothetical protein
MIGALILHRVNALGLLLWRSAASFDERWYSPRVAGAGAKSKALGARTVAVRRS